MKFLVLIFVLLLSASALAQTNTFQSQCYLPGEKIVTQGLNSTTFSISTYPRCQVDVYFTGTTTHAPISLANSSGTGGANPFTANTDGSWLFWALNGIGYDVKMTGGSPYVMPRTKTLVDLINGGGSAPPPASDCGPVTGDNSSTNCGFGNRSGDNAIIPAFVQSFGSTNLESNGCPPFASPPCSGASLDGQHVVAIGNSSGAGNHNHDVVAIGNQSYSNLNNADDADSDVVAIGNQNLAFYDTAQDAVAIGNQNLLYSDTSFTVAVGSGNGAGDSTHLCGFDSSTILIGDGNAIDCGSSSFSDVTALGSGNLPRFAPSLGGNFISVVAIGAGNVGNTVSPGSITTLRDVVGIGDFSARSLISGRDVIAIGDASGDIGHGTDIIAIGDASLTSPASATQSDIVAIGNNAANSLVAGSSAVVAIGFSPLNSSGGTDLVGIGDSVLGLSTGNDIVAIGDDAIGGNHNSNTGNDLVAIGNHACTDNSTGHDNVCIGDYAGSNGWTGGSTGNSNHTGINNVWIGDNAGPNTTTQLSNTIGIGFQAFNTASNQTVIGNSSMTQSIIFGSPRFPSILSAPCVGTDGSGNLVNNPGCSGGGSFTYPAGTGIVQVTGGAAWGTTLSKQGTDTSVLTSGTVSGTGATLCTDANGGATTSGCTSAGFPITIGSTPIAASSTTTSIAGLTLVAPALGTPTALVLTNATGLPLAGLTTQGANTLVANITAGTAVPTAVSIPTCNTAGSSALLYTPVTGFTCNTISGGGAVASVSNSDGTLTISPTTGAVVASLALGHANTWSATQTFVAPVLGTPASVNLTNATAIPAAAITGNLGNTHLAVQVANTVLGALTATTPSGLAMPSCSGATNGLIWTTSTGFGCNTFSSTGNTTSTALTTGTIPFANGANSIVDSHLSDTGTQLVYTGGGTAHGLSLAEGTTIAGSGGSDILYTNSTLHRWMQNPNNTGALIVPGVSASIAAGNVWVAASNGIDLIDGGPQFPVAAQTIVNCATSGTVTYSQPSTNASYKVIMAYAAACLGAASYTFPTAFVHSPQILSQSLTGIVSASSTTAVTVTGTTSTGFIELNGY